MEEKETNHSISVGGIDSESSCDIISETSGQVESNIKTIFVLETGDLRLLASHSDGPCCYVVSSHAMSFASPVWKKFLNPPFPRLSNNGEKMTNKGCKEIDFSEDNIEALLPLLHIAHLQFSVVPQTLSFKTLLEVAVLCDKYDCVELVKPWLPSWLVKENTQSQVRGNEQWLFIAWVFNREKIFESLVAQLAFRNKIEFPAPMPPYTAEAITNTRQFYIKELLNVPYRYVALFAAATEKKAICRRRYSPEACDVLVYGSLLKGLHKIDLWPQNSPESLEISVYDLAAQLLSIQIFIYPKGPRYASGSETHEECQLAKMKSEVDALLLTTPKQVMGIYNQYIHFLKRQRRK